MLKKIAFTFSIRALIAVSNLAIVILLSRYTGAQGKGEASLILTSIAMILLFCNIVGGSSLVYFVPRYNVFQLFILSNAWSVIVCIAAYFFFLNSTLIPVTFISSVIWLSLINSFLATNLTILLGKEKIALYNIVSLLQALINLVILFCMLKWMDQNNINTYILSLYVAMLFCLFFSTITILKYLTVVSFENIQTLFIKLTHYGFVNQMGHIMKFMSFRLNYYILSIYSGEALLGIFSNGVSLVESVLIISNSFCTILYPKVANSNDLIQSQKITLQFIKISMVLCLICLIPMLFLPSSFYTWLFGSEFSNVNRVIWILAPGIAFYNISLIIGHYFSGIGNYKIPTFANFIGLVTTIVISLIYIPTYGLTEASVISTISYLTTTFTISFYFIKQSKFKIHQLLPSYSDFSIFYNELKTFVKTN